MRTFRTQLPNARLLVVLLLLLGLQRSATAFMPTTVTTPRSSFSRRHYVAEETALELPRSHNIVDLQNEADHKRLMEQTTDSIVVLKVYAPWCRACKGLEPKFRSLANDASYNLPILQFASLTIQRNKSFVQKLGVLALPTIQFYKRGKLIDTFACGPSKVPLLKRKLQALLNEHVDPQTKLLKPEDDLEIEPDTPTEPDTAAEHTLTTTPSSIPQSQRLQYRESIPYFQSLHLSDLDHVLDQAQYRVFAPHTVVVREGDTTSRKFYIIVRGEVEICQTTGASAFHEYLGTVINRLGPSDYFGERTLITGEPRAASLRVTDQELHVWELDQAYFPHSNVLAGRQPEMNTESVNSKYGVDLTESLASIGEHQLKASAISSQIRGSVNTPKPIREDAVEGIRVENERTIFGLLRNFQMIRHVSQCFRYIQENKLWDFQHPGVITRRNMLVSRLSDAQIAEFTEIFKMMDVNGDGCIELEELQRLLSSIGDPAPTTLTNTGSSCLLMNFEEYMGIMAEAEFYHLFRDIFASLDPQETGFVKVRDLDRVLRGVRDLISSDRKSLIDTEDQDTLIDYEQFSRMLLGTNLI